jgi:myo-inositol-1(or 4)-monophosphatase
MGSADLYYEYGIHIWDMAAASLIATEAGCVVMSPDGSPLNLLHRSFLVSTSQQLANSVIPFLTHIHYDSD